MNVVPTLRSSSPGEAMRLINNAPRYINDAGFINILNQFDFNNKRNDSMITQQLNAFVGIPGLREKVQEWLKS
jgi:hypothetical protein